MRASVTILVLLLVLAALVTADLQSVVSAQSTDTDGTFSLVCAGSSLTFEMATIADIEVPQRAEIFLIIFFFCSFSLPPVGRRRV